MMQERTPCEITFGRTDGSATKTSPTLSRTKALRLANCMAYVLFKKHPFSPSTAHGVVRHQGDGFFVEYKECSRDERQ